MSSAGLHWKHDRAAYNRAKKKESLARETPEKREARLAKLREYQRSRPAQSSAERERRFRERHGDDARLLLLRAWRKANPEKVKALQRAANQRRRSSPTNRLYDAIARGLCAGLKGRKGRRKWTSLLGYSAEQLAEHLERQFIGEMSWSNFGSFWHIDHILPRVWFGTETEEAVIASWTLSNLRPLEATENRRKSGKRLFLI